MIWGRALSRGRTILVVEDNADHTVLVRLAARRVDPLLDVRIAPDGVEPVAYLAGDTPFGDRREHPFPDLVIPADLSELGEQVKGVVQEWVG